MSERHAGPDPASRILTASRRHWIPGQARNDIMKKFQTSMIAAQPHKPESRKRPGAGGKSGMMPLVFLVAKVIKKTGYPEALFG